MHAFGVPRSQPLRVLIDQENMDVIISDMTFYPEDMEGVSCTCLLARFVSTLDSLEKADAKKVSRDAINISNSKQFLLIVQCLAAGLSFRLVNTVATNRQQQM